MKGNNRVILKDNKDKRIYFLTYSAVFVFVAFFVYLFFIKSGNTIIRYMDPYSQHFTALEYYGKWLRTIAKTLIFEHRLDIPMWDFSIGMGSDVITTFNYYAIGDPLTLLSAFVPVKYTPYLYVFLFFLRSYLAGLFFSIYCMEKKHKNSLGILAGALTYCFCFYAVYGGSKHPFFINPMIYLPLILIGVEKILDKKSPIFLAIMVCIAEVSNFYFFYILVLFTVFYVIMRFIELYKFNIKAMLEPFFKIVASSVIGVLLGSVIFLPVIVRFISDSRTSVEFEHSLFYSIGYYLKLPEVFFSFDFIEPWTVLGYSVISIFAIVTFFISKKRNKIEKTFFVLAFCGLLTPIFGMIANGFSYPCNRWVFVFSFFVAYIVSQNFGLIFTRSKKNSLIIALVPILFILCGAFAPQSFIKSAAWGFGAVIISAALIILYSYKFDKLKKYKPYLQIAVISLGLIVVFINSYNYFNNLKLGWMTFEQAQTHKPGEVTGITNQIKLSGDEEFSRYTGDSLKYNAAVRKNLNSTQYYWSLSNGSISDFQKSTKLNEILYQLYFGFDDITSFNTLSSVKYYYDYVNDSKFIPYGFEQTETENVYENKNALPLGYTYNGYILREDFDKLETSAEMQQALLQGLVVDEEISGCEKINFKNEVSKIDFEVVCSKYVNYNDGVFTVTKNNKKAFFKIKGNKNSETYISFKGIDYKGTDIMELYTDNEDVDPDNLFTGEDFASLSKEEQNKIAQKSDVYKDVKMLRLLLSVCDEQGGALSTKAMQYYSPSFNHYSGKHDFDVNMGYSEDGYTVLAITFPYIGKYSFNDISVYSQTMDIYDEAVKNLSEDVLQNVNVQGDYVSGTINTDRSKLLCLSIPYSDGWKAYIDGEETELYKANLMNMAVVVSEGEHKIELEYETPYLKIGLIISILGLILLFGYGLWYNRQRNFLRQK